MEGREWKRTGDILDREKEEEDKRDGVDRGKEE